MDSEVHEIDPKKYLASEAKKRLPELGKKGPFKPKLSTIYERSVQEERSATNGMVPIPSTTPNMDEPTQLKSL